MKSEENTRDPLLHLFQFPLEEVFYPYGLPLLIRTNDARVCAAATESFGSFRRAADSEPLRLDVAIVGGDSGPFPSPPVIRSQSHLLWFVSDAMHFATCDFQSGVGVAWLTPRVFSDISRLRFHFLEAMGYSLVTERHLTGIHAACVARNGCGILLWGDAGAGKSCLAYALAKRGWTYITDDGSFLIRTASDSLIAGNPERIRFRPSAVELFPELDGLLPVERPNGKMTIELNTAALHLASRESRASMHHLIFLNRRASGAACLKPQSKDQAFRRLVSTNNYGRSRTHAENERALQRILCGDVFELTYASLEQAIACLESLVETGKR